MLKFKFTTLTPLHISNGEELYQNFHYTTTNDDVVYKIDPILFSRLIAKNKQINISEKITTKDIEKWVQTYKDDIFDKASMYSLESHDIFRSHLHNNKAEGRRQIREFINSNGKFYIPASSLKGALMTVMDVNHLGIDNKNASIKDKITLSDSDLLPKDSFMVYRTENRPPEINLICLKIAKTFNIIMKKTGTFNIEKFFSNLKNYNKTQKNNLVSEVSKFKSKDASRLKNADLFLKSIEDILDKINNGEPLINLGFGGGSWFKINKGMIPRFKSKNPRKRNTDEPAHSSTALTINNDLFHIGWCKVEIDKV